MHATRWHPTIPSSYRELPRALCSGTDQGKDGLASRLERYKSRLTLCPFCVRFQYDKMSVTRQLIDLLSQAGSRFLKYNHCMMAWEELSDMATRDKVGHALRFANRVTRKPVVTAIKSLSSPPPRQQQSSQAATKIVLVPAIPKTEELPNFFFNGASQIEISSQEPVVLQSIPAASELAQQSSHSLCELNLSLGPVSHHASRTAAQEASRASLMANTLKIAGETLALLAVLRSSAATSSTRSVDFLNDLPTWSCLSPDHLSNDQQDDLSVLPTLEDSWDALDLMTNISPALLA
jgi:hypothetical protein